MIVSKKLWIIFETLIFVNFYLFWNFFDTNFCEYITSQSFLQHKFLQIFSGQICKNKCCQNLFSQNCMSLRRTTKLRKTLCLSVRNDRTSCYLACISTGFDTPPLPKCEWNNGMRPSTKFVFHMIFNCNIFYAFRKVIPSLSNFKLEAIKALGINFRKHHSATWSESVLLFHAEIFRGFWEFIQLKHLVEINYRGLVIK